MKKAFLSVALIFGLATPAFAVAKAMPTTEADCVKAGGSWNANQCAEHSAKWGRAAGTHAGTYLGGPPETHKL
jgi:hypothetical protein